MTKTIRWGILGTGNIARQFATGLQSAKDAALVAVGSRAEKTAEKFGKKFNVERRHACYADLANDPEVDVVYVSSPHQAHKDDSILCLRAGKAVLCEKPFTINRPQAEELVAVARAEKRFLMEAMWTRFLPAVAQVRKWLKEGVIGEPRMVQADFGFRTDVQAEGRLFDPACGGGSLLDVGIYPLSFACMVFGAQPTEIQTLADIGETGVDEQAAMALGYSGGRMALLASAVRTNTPQDARIMGTEGIIHIPSPYWKGTQAVLTLNGKDPQVVDCPYEGNGYNCEAEAVGDCLRDGKLEHDTMPLDESLALMETMDRIRAQWGLKYPME
jgi:dihydrodiol dehydrogenase / D-xylose 1-dehydrogenase (NADP)